MTKVAIIVAGGIGSRMAADLPKQFLPIANEPLLFHTLRKFENSVDQLILVMHPEWITYWNDLIAKYSFNVKHSIVAGGQTRAQSVLNGLEHVENDCLVAIHDAARPTVTKELIDSTFKNAEKHGACIPIIDIKDSIREISEDGNSKAVNRSKFKSVQTPQTFQASILKAAFENKDYEKYTDDASLAEANGTPVFLIEGEEQNIKVTTASDLILVASFI
jgi:2-C-methyl-D-erythritol 4-phosphate cytidylyltransferase